ncbi:MAG: TIGR04086 family membrane protein [Acutalibacter sp.]|jgi:putative membrane protein (TIGR04086 family)
MKKVKGMLLSAAVAAVTAGILLMVIAAILSSMGSLPMGPILTVVVTGSVCAGVFLGSLISALFVGEKGILLGGGTGLLFALVVAGVSLMTAGTQFTVGGGARLAAIFLSGCIGGILGVNRDRKVKF